MEGCLVSTYISHDGPSIAKYPWRWLLKEKRHWALGSAHSMSCFYQFVSTAAHVACTRVLAYETKDREAKGLFQEEPQLVHTCCLPWDEMALKPWFLEGSSANKAASLPHDLCGGTRIHTWFNVLLLPSWESLFFNMETCIVFFFYLSLSFPSFLLFFLFFFSSLSLSLSLSLSFSLPLSLPSPILLSFLPSFLSLFLSFFL
jgi:hypothetical protein